MASDFFQQRNLLTSTTRRRRSRPRRWQALAIVVAIVMIVWFFASNAVHGATPRFFADDPLAREPETQDASAARPYDINLGADLFINLFTTPGDATPNVRAGDVNTIDEVPDSSWFTNRIYAKPLSVEDLARGPNTIDGPATGRWTVTGAKTAGFAPGFRMRDSRGGLWFVSLDAKGAPRAATGAIAVACRLFWALGYNQVESYLSSFRPEHLAIDEAATVETRPRHKRPMKMSDIEAVLDRAARDPDGSYRVIAARAIPGRVLGGFRFDGTRPDDPNDIVPHEHRRSLRALKVFGAWTNLVDLKALNTIDTVVDDNGRHVVRHYLQDVGSTFGTGANGPHDWDEGREYLFQGDTTWRRLITGGFFLQPWQLDTYFEHPEIGRIEAQGFDPEQWKSRTPIAAVRQARDDDTFWAALRVSAFTDDLIRAAVREARYADPEAENILATVLIERRRAIERAYLPKISPLTRFALDGNGLLTFENPAVRVGVSKPPAAGYRGEWFAFDNTTGRTEPLGVTTSSEERLDPPPAWPRARGSLAYLKVVITALEPANPTWSRPIDVYFRRSSAGWQVVGIDRLVG